MNPIEKNFFQRYQYQVQKNEASLYMAIQIHVNTEMKIATRKRLGDSALYLCLYFLGHLIMYSKKSK